MTDLATNLLLSAAVFAGAFVSGLAGFAFSAVAARSCLAFSSQWKPSR
jgi:hypothetical protein